MGKARPSTARPTVDPQLARHNQANCRCQANYSWPGPSPVGLGRQLAPNRGRRRVDVFEDLLRFGRPVGPTVSKFGWVESDQCWWCSCGRQSREHLFKECWTWKNEIRELWRKVGEISGEGKRGTDRHGPRRRNKGFGLRPQRHRVGPGNCPIRKLFCEPLFAEAVLEFLEKTEVGKIKKGVIVRGEAVE